MPAAIRRWEEHLAIEMHGPRSPESSNPFYPDLDELTVGVGPDDDVA